MGNCAPFVTIISTQFNIYTFFYRDVPFCIYVIVYKIVCCRCVECGKGLNLLYSRIQMTALQQTYFENIVRKHKSLKNDLYLFLFNYYQHNNTCFGCSVTRSCFQKNIQKEEEVVLPFNVSDFQGDYDFNCLYSLKGNTEVPCFHVACRCFCI